MNRILPIFCRQLVKILPENLIQSVSESLISHALDEKKQEHNQNLINNVTIRYLPNTIYHLSAFTYVNTGDFILVNAMRDSIAKITGCMLQWENGDVRKIVTEDMIEAANKSKALLIGGGGLFLKDTNPNQISGWQWPCPIDKLNKITTPLFVMGVGYNRFRGQDDFDDVFTENINAVVEKSAVFGMRNHGSIEALKKYLRPEQQKKLIYHPCATTILSKIYTLPVRKANEKPVIALNCAFDRANLRYGDKESEYLTNIALAMKELTDEYVLKIYAHTAEDVQICPYLDKNRVSYETVMLNKMMNVDELLNYYTVPDLVIGMRGHAQLIPFGCRTPIISIISHDKMQWFLNDIGHPEWGVEINDGKLSEKIVDKAKQAIMKHDSIQQEIDEIQDRLWKVTSENILMMNHIVTENQENVKNAVK